LNSRSRRNLFAAVAGLALLTVGCGGAPNAATITLTDFKITSGLAQVRAGQPVTLTIVNGGRVDHNLKLDPVATDAALPETLKPGERTTVTLSFKASGTFGYACTLPGHAPAGMTGTVTVVS